MGTEVLLDATHCIWHWQCITRLRNPACVGMHAPANAGAVAYLVSKQHGNNIEEIGHQPGPPLQAVHRVMPGTLDVRDLLQPSSSC